MTHTCHWPGCDQKVPPRMWGCRKHWFDLPPSIRTKILEHYRPGQEVDKRPSKEYLEAAHAAKDWIIKWQMWEQERERIRGCTYEP
jgi:hypothetical protein